MVAGCDTYRIEIFHGLSGLRDKRDCGTVDCPPGDLTPLMMVLAAACGCLIGQIETRGTDELDDYEICVFVRKVPE